jgi:hypothetical protein
MRANRNEATRKTSTPRHMDASRDIDYSRDIDVSRAIDSRARDATALSTINVARAEPTS